MNKIIIIGDTFFSNDKDKSIFFEKINKNFNDYLVIANLEGSIKLNNIKPSRKAMHISLPAFKQHEIPDNLIFSLVNNHVTDFGIDNFKSNLDFFGKKAVISTHKKISNQIGSKKFIFLADEKEECVFEGTGFLKFSNKDVSRISNEIESAIVIIHGGIEFRYFPTPYQRALARSIIEYGAHKVIFHHSHIIGHHEYWKGCLIHYGLGNAFFSDTSDIHSLDKSISQAIICGEKENIVEFDQLDVKVMSKVNYNFEINKMHHSDYVKFYKKEYKIDSSFRPRQLSVYDTINSIQFICWITIARFIFRIKLSKKIKSWIDIFLKKDL